MEVGLPLFRVELASLEVDIVLVHLAPWEVGYLFFFRAGHSQLPGEEMQAGFYGRQKKTPGGRGGTLDPPYPKWGRAGPTTTPSFAPKF